MAVATVSSSAPLGTRRGLLKLKVYFTRDARMCWWSQVSVVSLHSGEMLPNETNLDLHILCCLSSFQRFWQIYDVKIFLKHSCGQNKTSRKNVWLSKVKFLRGLWIIKSRLYISEYYMKFSCWQKIHLKTKNPIQFGCTKTKPIRLTSAA